MRLELRRTALLCCLVVSGCSHPSGSTPALPPSLDQRALARTTALPDSAFDSLYSFGKNPYDGSQPTFLVPYNGKLYGTTCCGSPGGEGTVFSLTPDGKETILHTFMGSDGGVPNGPLLNAGGVFYGTVSSGGGPSSLGAVFSIDTDGNFNVVRAFQGGSNDGLQPYGGLVELDGTLYGTTLGGGANGDGTVYGITPQGVEHLVHSFNGSDGQEPLSTLIVVNGDLYGTTLTGGKFGGGTIFRVTTAGKVKVLHNFGRGNDGNAPYFGALVDVDGTLVGTTIMGGRKGVGTIFESTLDGTESVLYSFPGTPAKGCEPYAGLIEFNGTLYGTTVGGSGPGCSGHGTVYQYVPSGGVMTLRKFPGGNGGAAPVGLTSMGGSIYGVTLGGGRYGQGLFYSVTP